MSVVLVVVCCVDWCLLFWCVSVLLVGGCYVGGWVLGWWVSVVLVGVQYVWWVFNCQLLCGCFLYTFVFDDGLRSQLSRWILAKMLIFLIGMRVSCVVLVLLCTDVPDIPDWNVCKLCSVSITVC